MSAQDGAESALESSGVRRRRLVALLDAANVADHGGVRTPDRSEPRTHDQASGSWLRARLQRVCVVSVSEVGVDGAGITVLGGAVGGRAGHRDLLAATGALTRRLEDLQLTAGEGPCLDAYVSGVPVLAGDLAAETARWLGLGPDALAAGAAALFSLPLQVGAARLGTLDLHRATAGGLTRAELANAVTLAGLATETLLELLSAAGRSHYSDHDSSDGATRGRSEEGPELGWLPDVHAKLHVAVGMVSVQLDVDVGAALLRIRAFAFSSGEPISEVARRIVERDLVLDLSDPCGRGDTDHDGPAPPNSSPEGDD